MGISRGRRTRPRVQSSAPKGSHVVRNKGYWDAKSGEYERRHGASLRAVRAMAWGFYRLPERNLRLLGPTQGRRILELGCGAGRWSAALKAGGGRPIGLDISGKRLAQASVIQRRQRIRFPLVHADAERLPFRAATFDIVFCDWGAMTFCDPHRTVPEVGRVIRAGGVFAFSTSTPFRSVAQERNRDRIGRNLRYPYFGLHQIDYPEETDFQLEYGEWVRVFRDCGFRIDRLIEPRARRFPVSSYLSAEESAWARNWPIEMIWRLIRESGRRKPIGPPGRRAPNRAQHRD
jgi:ubiquinone/menaquinone biosynthesis C-methylase UbiE